MKHSLQFGCIISYLCAIIAANGLVTYFGQAALPFTAFVLIPFDLFARDVLHEYWKGKHLWTKMAALIITGSLLSFFTTIASAQVSFASAVAFLCTGFADVVAYYFLDRAGCSRFVRMNGSNAFSAVVDSLVFPALAFSSVIFSLSAAQAIAKFLGGFVWSALFLCVTNWRTSSASNYEEA